MLQFGSRPQVYVGFHQQNLTRARAISTQNYRFSNLEKNNVAVTKQWSDLHQPASPHWRGHLKRSRNGNSLLTGSLVHFINNLRRRISMVLILSYNRKASPHLSTKMNSLDTAFCQCGSPNLVLLPSNLSHFASKNWCVAGGDAHTYNPSTREVARGSEVQRKLRQHETLSQNKQKKAIAKMVSEGGEIPARDWRTQCVTIDQMNHPALCLSYPDSQLSTIVCDSDCKHVDFPAFWNPQMECLLDSTVNSCPVLFYLSRPELLPSAIHLLSNPAIFNEFAGFVSVLCS